jgi:hypothetical protein
MEKFVGLRVSAVAEEAMHSAIVMYEDRETVVIVAIKINLEILKEFIWVSLGEESEASECIPSVYPAKARTFACFLFSFLKLIIYKYVQVVYQIAFYLNEM